MTKTNEQFTTVITPAYITATSNKVSKDFVQETPTKTVYFTRVTRLRSHIIYTRRQIGRLLYCKSNKIR